MGIYSTSETSKLCVCVCTFELFALNTTKDAILQRFLIGSVTRSNFACIFVFTNIGYNGHLTEYLQ